MKPKVKAPNSVEYFQTRDLMRELKLNTVCEEASCPNIGECWAKKHATIMILGSVCTRACKFCDVATGIPDKLDPHEPERVASALEKLDLNHIVITSVDRDDLPDGGANHFSKVVNAIRMRCPGATIEILTPDFKNKPGATEIIAAANPDVFNHNLETVPRLYKEVRPGASYFNSLRLLENVKKQNPKVFTKSGLMVGLGEEQAELYQVMDDLRQANVDFLTIGQYLQPSPKHHPVLKYYSKEEFEEISTIARAKGFLLVSASSLTRSSYHAGDDFAKLQKARLKHNL